MPSDRKLQSASNKHGQCVEYIARRVRGGIELRNTWEMVQHDVFLSLAMSQCTPDVALIDVLVEDLKKSGITSNYKRPSASDKHGKYVLGACHTARVGCDGAEKCMGKCRGEMQGKCRGNGQNLVRKDVEVSSCRTPWINTCESFIWAESSAICSVMVVWEPANGDAHPQTDGVGETGGHAWVMR